MYRICYTDQLLLLPIKKKVLIHRRNKPSRLHLTNVSQCNAIMLFLPSASPVLIQSGFAILAMAKISAARKRHPEIMVNLSISHCVHTSVN